MDKNYIDLIEQDDRDYTRFEKVLMTAKRAKEFYELEESARAIMLYKPTYRAILEANNDVIRPTREVIKPIKAKALVED
ncbi:MAG: DNA-directed RNA polymerase subunit omega [SAR324 cluster bacterium]|nr:DNA-directed RNA polymerase subunit omega [SAR324 cluster bacterium]